MKTQWRVKKAGCRAGSNQISMYCGYLHFSMATSEQSKDCHGDQEIWDLAKV